MKKKSLNYFSITIFVIFLVTFKQYSYAYPFENYLKNPPKQTEITIFLKKQTPFVSNTLYKEKNWIPIKDLFQPYVDSIVWDHKKKIAYVNNDGKQLIINFSKTNLNVNNNQFLVPLKHTKFINNQTYIDGFWIGWVFDMYALKGDDVQRDKLRGDLSFLGIQEVDMPYESIPKDKTLHLAIYFKEK